MKKLFTIISCVSLSLSSYGQVQGDVTFNSSISHNHDSTQCATEIYLSSNTLINNSFFGDSVKWIAPGGIIMFEEENTTGAAQWSVNYPFQGMQFIESDYNIDGAGYLNTSVQHVL